MEKTGLPIPTKFQNIPEFYVPGQSIECCIQIDEEFASNVTRRDWIGLFEVGWKYLHSYITFEWVSVPELVDGHNVMVVKFNSRTLPAKPKVSVNLLILLLSLSIATYSLKFGKPGPFQDHSMESQG